MSTPLRISPPPLTGLRAAVERLRPGRRRAVARCPVQRVWL